ncbi:MAG TPA: sulfurtransferase TusA family protein [Nitrospirae bacterium]|nr:sulfur transfer protein SirA [bacterium BMS3Abin09]HDH33949.1 sulfurtransferase TusA family protein [Nitrospirota bacterium]HDN95380.1 sulfurtransferase TusA family protein [Nitrospirota bacterium]HDZ84348.1 sulfurtransferase TusA family protein [Nitrospirota bacterium]
MSLADAHNLDSDHHMFLNEPLKADAETDIIYMMCPMHLLTIDEQVKEIKIGEILSILTDYEGAIEDIPEWCEKTGNEFLGIYEENDHYKFYIKKIRES